MKPKFNKPRLARPLDIEDLVVVRCSMKEGCQTAALKFTQIRSNFNKLLATP